MRLEHGTTRNSPRNLITMIYTMLCAFLSLVMRVSFLAMYRCTHARWAADYIFRGEKSVDADWLMTACITIFTMPSTCICCLNSGFYASRL